MMQVAENEVMAEKELLRGRESPNYRLDPSAVVRLLKGIERLPDRATGALVFGPSGQRAGTVLVEGKKVCWAAATQMRTRLTDLLRRQSSRKISVETIELVYQRCLRDRTPLGEALVSGGLISAECLRTVLCQHAAEGLAALSCSTNLTPKWVPCRQERYDPRFTFSTTELLARVGALGDEDRAASAHAHLAAAIPGTHPGAAFGRGENQRGFLPISQVHGERVGTSALIELGRWAKDSLGVCDRVIAGCRVLVSSSTAGEAIVAWTDESVVYVASCEGSIAMHRILARQLRLHEGDGRDE